MSEKREYILTPVGFAKWAHVQSPKQPFKDERGVSKGDPKYQIDVVFDEADPEWAKFVAAIKRRMDALPQQVDKKTKKPIDKQEPIKYELDGNDQPTGRKYVTFKTGEKFPPGVFDKYNEPLKDNVGNESKVRVSFTPVPYEAFGGGLALYLNAVQVLELVEFGKRSADSYGFTAEAAPDFGASPHGQDGEPLPF